MLILCNQCLSFWLNSFTLATHKFTIFPDFDCFLAEMKSSSCFWVSDLSSSVLSSDSMHIGILAAAAHASANNSPFTVFYNPRSISVTVTDFILLILMHNLSVTDFFSFLYVQGQSLRICYSIGQVLQGSIQPSNITWHAL
jgi:hypothetical protein